MIRTRYLDTGSILWCTSNFFFFLTKFKFNIVISQTSLWDALTVHGHRGLYSSTIFREILVDHTFANSNLRVITFTSLLVLTFSVNGFMKKCFQNDSKNSKKKKKIKSRTLFSQLAHTIVLISNFLRANLSTINEKTGRSIFTKHDFCFCNSDCNLEQKL